jgi:thiol-disulfide isomerase/thioredoxin
MLKTLQNFILVALAIILTAVQSAAGLDVKVYKLKSVDNSNDVNTATNFYWDNAGVETNLFKEANGRTIVMSFLGTWCAYCQRHLPELKKLYDYLPKGDYYFINVFGEYNLERENNVISEIQIEEIEYDNVWYSFTEPSNMQLFEIYNITQVITTLIITPEKKIAAKLSDITYSSALDTLNKLASGISDKSLNPELKISPNPISGVAFLQYSVTESCNVIFKVYNSLGTVVYSLNKMEYNSGISGIQFDASAFSQGMYYYTLQIGEKIYNDKLLIVR